VGLKGYVDTRFNSSTANVANIVSSIATLVSNAASQAGDLTQLYSDRDAHTTLISGLQSQLTANASTVNTLRANVGSFYTWANTNFGTSNYGNATVAAYLPTSTFIANISGNVTAANTAFNDANIRMKDYVDAKISTVRATATVSNIARFIWVENSAPISTQGNIGDIWYQY
jgi:uncharacterized protein YjfI (DUF2170 family)